MALELNWRGFDARNLYAMVGGLGAWEKAGYPVTTGD